MHKSSKARGWLTNRVLVSPASERAKIISTQHVLRSSIPVSDHAEVAVIWPSLTDVTHA